MTEIHQYVRVEFKRFKAFEDFSLSLRHFNILVGPNNTGKSTILAAFRILAAAMRRARARKPEVIDGPQGKTFGYSVDLESISVAEENIFFNYDEAEAATVRFILSNGNKLLLYFPESGVCNLLVETQGRPVRTPTAFRSQFKCEIGFVPILGPVEHNERLYEKEAARRALFNYQASRNFRNIWHHYPDDFEEFSSVLRETWPGMDIQRPYIDTTHGSAHLYMLCPEVRIPREIFWAGFGFQVWCQMLTHLIQSKEKSIFLIDEPDIYLHSDLQRQLLTLLRNLGPDIVIATHSTEIISDAEAEEIVVINKQRKKARRIRDQSQLGEVFAILGSNLNPVLTQLAKTRRVVFVEGSDFQIIGKFARKLGFTDVGNRSEFAVVAVEGFNPERMRSLKKGMEETLGTKVRAAAIFDRDYRCRKEVEKIVKDCGAFCDFVAVHNRKEIENFLLVSGAINRAATRRAMDRARRTGQPIDLQFDAEYTLQKFAETRKSAVTAQFLAETKRFERTEAPKLSDATINQAALEEMEEAWKDQEARLALLPGKEALSGLNQELQNDYNISVTATAIVDAMSAGEIPQEMKNLVAAISEFITKTSEP